MAISTIGNTGHSAPLPAAAQGAAASPKTPAVGPAPAAHQPSSEQVQKAMEAIKQMVTSTSANSLNFSVDDQTGKTVVSVTDAETGEMIRQIPSKELLEIAHSLDKLQGMLLKQKA